MTFRLLQGFRFKTFWRLFQSIFFKSIQKHSKEVQSSILCRSFRQKPWQAVGSCIHGIARKKKSFYDFCSFNFPDIIICPEIAA